MFHVEHRMSMPEGKSQPIPHWCVVETKTGRTKFVGDARDRKSADKKCAEFIKYPARAPKGANGRGR